MTTNEVLCWVAGLLVFVVAFYWFSWLMKIRRQVKAYYAGHKLVQVKTKEYLNLPWRSISYQDINDLEIVG